MNPRRKKKGVPPEHNKQWRSLGRKTDTTAASLKIAVL